ncbi:1-deoxy-D-xylulose-5-phosphate synthase [Cellulosilyticum ruminicola]|uniref:1-deoxy-D-xylulose-5-phosphate synthase n=1 Tax=Cellulosilyticum ruminicola TaxID=425254 RepID=UPI0006D197F0|nr:1-deoxy-D-xylulose-5-phosphate synthase [Cellulosilyticum ruminicola]
MLDLLKKIQSPSDIKNLNAEELEQLAKETRSFLVQSLSKTGGHLASNLGVVELTLALHYVFDSPCDKMVWDVGHQAYVHKLLTGRRKDFKTLRQMGGMSGFPKRRESEHDVFETGHSSTSISAALGMAKARDLAGEDYAVIAVIGDGALTGGMAFEALNNAGRGGSNLIVILNDNEMSISKNVGGLGKYLNHLRSSQDYLRVKADVEDVLHKVPVVGNHMVKTIKRTKESVKSFVIQNTLFEQLGFTYFGPIDGHNLEELIHLFENVKSMSGPILIHLKTKKGKGYRIAEEKPSSFHGVSPFCIETGESLKKVGSQTFSGAFGQVMCELVVENPKVVGITAAMPEGTGLLEFAKRYPRHFFDVGIAEQHAVTFAAGMASNGYKPFVAVYSTFLQRAYDQISHDVCLQKLPVVLGVDRAGIVGEDGSTHQGIYDIAFLKNMPYMTILSPKLPEEMGAAMRYALSLEGPVAIRYPRGGNNIDRDYINLDEWKCLKTLKQGNNIAILSSGRSMVTALEVSKLLEEEEIHAAVIEAACLFPLDEKGLNQIASDYNYLFTLEDGILEGGFGESVFAYFVTHNKIIKGKAFGYETGMISHGEVSEVLKREGLDAVSLKTKILKHIEESE